MQLHLQLPQPAIYTLESSHQLFTKIKKFLINLHYNSLGAHQTDLRLSVVFQSFSISLYFRLA